MKHTSYIFYLFFYCCCCCCCSLFIVLRKKKTGIRKQSCTTQYISRTPEIVLYIILGSISYIPIHSIYIINIKSKLIRSQRNILDLPSPPLYKPFGLYSVLYIYRRMYKYTQPVVYRKCTAESVNYNPTHIETINPSSHIEQQQHAPFTNL